MKDISTKGEIIQILTSKQDWIRKIPQSLPRKEPGEKWLWLDKNGNAVSVGIDFSVCEEAESYPITVYRLQRAIHAYPEAYLKRMEHGFKH